MAMLPLIPRWGPPPPPPQAPRASELSKNVKAGRRRQFRLRRLEAQAIGALELKALGESSPNIRVCGYFTRRSKYDPRFASAATDYVYPRQLDQHHSER